MSFRVTVRIFINGELEFRETIDALDSELASIADRYMERIKHEPIHMVELEFLDIPDPNERFFRFGTDPRAMVKPLAINIGGAGVGRRPVRPRPEKAPSP